MTGEQRPACYHCDKILNSPKYAEDHYQEVHEVDINLTDEEIEKWDWPEGA